MRKEHWALLSLGINTLQALAKLIAGLLTGSLSMIGESFHSLSDSFSSLITYFTLRFSEKKSEKFPYGLYKLENVGSILIAVFLLLASYEILKRAFSLQVRIKEEYMAMGFVVISFSLLSSLLLSFLERKAGKKLNSPVLIADSYHTLTDAFGSSLVLMSFISSYVGYELDRYFAIGVSLLISYTALNILRKEVSVLLDVSADQNTLSRIRDIILSFEEVLEIKHLFVRSSGGRLFADITLVVSGRDFLQMHSVVDRIEEKLKVEVPQLEMVFIHYEPKQEATLGVLLNEKGEVSENFSNTSRVMLLKKGEKPQLLTNIPREEQKLAQFLMEKGVCIILCRHHPESKEAKWTISKYGAFVWETQEKNPYLAISEVAYNFSDVQTAHKERKDHRPI